METKLLGPVGRRIIGLASIPLALLAFGALLAGITPNLPFGVTAANRERYEEKLLEIRKQSQMLELAARGRGAKVFHSTAAHDFKVVDPSVTEKAHEFEVENRGTGDLVLTALNSSCQCTKAELEKRIISPGESGKIRVVWNSEKATSGPFEEAIYIGTNDPRREKLKFTVKGEVARRFAVQGPIAGSGELQGTPIRGETLLYSQTFDVITVVETTTSSPSVKLEVEPASPSVVKDLGAQAAVKLVATYFPTDGAKEFDETVRARVISPASKAEEWVDVPFTGKYRSRVSFFGPEIDSRSGIDLGLIELGSDQTWSFGVRLLGDPPPESLAVTAVEPSSLVASVEPSERLPGTFRVTLQLAKDAEPVRFTGERQGFVEVAAADDPAVSSWMPLTGQIIPPIKD